MKPGTTTRAVIRTIGRSLDRSLGFSLRSSPSVTARPLNRSHAPVGMLDLERITRVQPPISTVTSRPLSTAFTSTSTKV
jgi:hypothetical protein